jgi:hypothetical protein
VTHLVYAASYLRALLEAGEQPVEVVVLDTGTFLGLPRVGPEQVADHLPTSAGLSIVEAVGASRWRRPADGRWVLLSIGAPGLRALSTMVGRGHARPHVVVVDEGIGSYGDWRTRFAAYRRGEGSRVRSLVRAAAVQSGNRILVDERWTTFVRAGSTWAIRREVAAEFRNQLHGSAPQTPTVVYLSQPWPEVGVMPLATYQTHLQDVAKVVAAQGLRFRVRLHPAQDPAPYAQFDASPGHGPAELDRSVVGARVVVGSNSTALLNIRAMYGIQAVRVTTAELARLEVRLSWRQRELLDAFLPPPIEVSALGAHLSSR